MSAFFMTENNGARSTMPRRKRLRLVALVVLVLLIVTAGSALAWAMRYSEIAAIEPPPAASFDAALIAKGQTLVAFGDCEVCHTRPGGLPFSGGLKLPTPFGAIYSTNITPDKETGI